MADNPVIIITRPEPQASRFADQVRQAVGASAGIEILPLRAYEFFGNGDDLAGYDAVVFTSETGVRAADRIWQGPRGRAFTVGGQTAKVAAEHGWKAQSADGAGPDLARMIAESGFQGRLVWPSGRAYRPEFPTEAERLGVVVDRVPVYALEPTGAEAKLSKVVSGAATVILPVFSPESARVLAAELAGAKAQIKVVAISAAAAAPFSDLAETTVADRPNAAAIIDAVAAIFPPSTP